MADTRKEYNIIGKRGIPRRFGFTKAAGTAVYTRDVRRPGMLFAKALRNPYGHAKIKSMDTSKAAAYPGVRGVLRYDDPEIVNSANPEMLMNESWHEGGPIGCIIAADTIQIAEEAIKLVDVEWEVLTHYLDMEAAIAEGATVLYPEHFPESNNYTSWLSAFMGGDELIREHDLDAGFAEADVVWEEDIEYKKGYHAGSEPRSYVFEWGADGTELNIWSHSQTPGTEGPMAQGDRLLIPRMLGIPTSHVKIHNTFQGGTFGGKISLEHIFVAAAVLAKKVNAPLIFMENRSEDVAGREDAGLRCHIKIGAKNDGTITAIHLDPAIVEIGDSGVEGEGFIWVVVGGAKPADMIREVLKTPNIETENRYALTSKTCATSFRCEKNQSGFIQTKINQLVSAKLGLDPVEVALKNGNCATNSLEEVIRIGKESFGWNEKWHLPGTKKLANGKMHGVGFTYAHMWHAGGSAQFGSFGLGLDFDGSATLSSATSDVGVSAHTTYIMIAAEELGFTVDKVHYPITNTDLWAAKSPGGSCGCATNAPLIKMVAQQVKSKALNLFAPKFGVTAEELDIKDNMVFVKADPTNTKAVAELCSSFGCDVFPLVGSIDATIPPGSMTVPYNCFQAHFCEVEVDPETGKIDVTKVVCVNDFGQMIRPESCEGQMYGGYYMGLGPNIMEENIYDDSSGCRLNDNLCDYKYALMNDTAFPTVKAEQIALDLGVYGNVGAGEPTGTITRGLVNPAVCNALGINMNKNPILPGDILKALGKA